MVKHIKFLSVIIAKILKLLNKLNGKPVGNNTYLQEMYI